MAGSDIAAKVKAGLAKAQAAVSDGKNLVEIEIETLVRDPINGDQVTSEWQTLTDAIFKSYNKNQIDGVNVLAGDRQLVANGDIEIKQGAKVRAYGENYIIVDIDFKKPSDVLLAQICQCRRQ